MSVRVDPQSGLKIFATRAAKASEKIAGKGYSTITDEALKTLPPAPVGAVFDAVNKPNTASSKSLAQVQPTTCRWRANSVVI